MSKSVLYSVCAIPGLTGRHTKNILVCLHWMILLLLLLAPHYDTDYPPWVVPQNKGDLKSISGLIPDSIYYIEINDLVASFLTDDSGVLYFNDKKQALPTSCLAWSRRNKIHPAFTPLGSPGHPIQQYLWTFKDNQISMEAGCRSTTSL